MRPAERVPPKPTPLPPAPVRTDRLIVRAPRGSEVGFAVRHALAYGLACAEVDPATVRITFRASESEERTWDLDVDEIEIPAEELRKENAPAILAEKIAILGAKTTVCRLRQMKQEIGEEEAREREETATERARRAFSWMGSEKDLNGEPKSGDH